MNQQSGCRLGGGALGNKKDDRQQLLRNMPVQPAPGESDNGIETEILRNNARSGVDNVSTRGLRYYIPTLQAGKGDLNSLPLDIKSLFQSTDALEKTLLEESTITVLMAHARRERLCRVESGSAGELDNIAVSESSPESSPAAAGARSKLDNLSIPALDMKCGGVLPDHLARLSEHTDRVAKTLIDQGALKEIVKKDFVGKELKLNEELKIRAAEPAKIFKHIENYRTASVCSSAWDKMTGSGSVRFCERCKLQVYDFSTTELPEAEEMIFKREGKKSVTLVNFRRRFQ